MNGQEDKYKVPKEIKGYAVRVKEQNACFLKILATVSDDLKEIKNMFDQYDSDLSDELVKLNESLDNYKVKADKIATEAAERMETYALNSIQNVAELRESISSITNMINNI